MHGEKVNELEQLRLQLSIAKEKERQISLLGEVFMNHICTSGAKRLEEDELNTYNSAFYRALRGIQEFTM